MEEHYRTDFEKRLVEYRDQLETVKLELEEKYQNEMEVLREEYELKVEDLVRDLSNTHKTEIQNIESKHAKEIQNLKEKLQLESAKWENTVHLECAKEVEKVRMEMADEHRKELEILKDMYEDELKKQIEQLTYRMKQGEEEHIATTKSELLSKHVRDIQKLEDSFVDQTGRASNDPVLLKVRIISYYGNGYLSITLQERPLMKKSLSPAVEVSIITTTATTTFSFLPSHSQRHAICCYVTFPGDKVSVNQEANNFCSSTML